MPIPHGAGSPAHRRIFLSGRSALWPRIRHECARSDPHHGSSGCVQRHAARQLDLDTHIGSAALEGLKRANRNAELLALLQIVERDFTGAIHDADCFGTYCGDCLIDDPLYDWQRRSGLANDAIIRDSCLEQVDLGRA